jgi:hypothetical protein
MLGSNDGITHAVPAPISPVESKHPPHRMAWEQILLSSAFACNRQLRRLQQEKF